MKKIFILLLLLFLSVSLLGNNVEQKIDQIVDQATAIEQITETIRDTVVSSDADELLVLIKDYVTDKTKEKIQPKVDDFINKKITGNREKKLLRNAFDKLGKESISAQELVDITLCFQTSALKSIINKNLGSHEAELVCNALDGFMEKGADGALDVGQNELNRLINKYVKGEAAQKSLIDAVQKIRDNRIEDINVGQIAKNVTQGAINDWIDRQDWNASQKEKAKMLVDAGLTDGIDGITDAAKQMIVNKVTKELGEEAGKAMENIINQIIDYDPKKESIRESGSTIAYEIMRKTIDKQYEKLCNKYPLLGKIMDHLKIKDDFLDAAANIKQLIVEAKSVKEFIYGILNITVDLFKTLAKKLVNFAKNLLNSLVNQLGKIAEKLIQKAMDWLQSFVKQLTQKVIDELIDFAKKLADRIAQLTKQVVYVVNQAKATVETVIETFENIKEATGALFRNKNQNKPDTTQLIEAK